ncbi:MAG: tyrosinase family protein [Nitrospira sp.]|nr:tyrosinase family protein [Nitrospira sp. BO4]
MAVTRPNLLTNAVARQQYARGVNLLKQEFPGPTTSSLGIPGPSTPVSTYDLFVVWHHTAMMTMTPPDQGDRNAAHRGPVFFPWHRFMLIQLELNLQRVLNDATFGLPYWDWATDGQRTAAQQRRSRVWRASAMGGTGTPVRTGPFRFRSGNPTSFRVRIEADENGQLAQSNRGLSRALGSFIQTLPDKTDTEGVLALTPYDTPNWDTTSAGFRNRSEGWAPPDAPALHNRVHVWVGGDMLPSTSPNDPVFYMNHCNIDRLWEAWLTEHGRTYRPLQSAPAFLQGHRINDEMSSLISAPMTPADMLDVRSIYVYDSIEV